MSSLFRDSPLGQCIRYVSRKRFCTYPEDHGGFDLPESLRLQLSSLVSTHKVTESADEPQLLPEPSRHRLSHELAKEDVQSEKALSDTSATSNDYRKHMMVDWYSDDDPDNPMNWTSLKKTWVHFVLLSYVVAVYIGSSLYTASIEDIMEIFHVGQVTASLGLALYVLGYGIGALLFSPLSEIPAVGRNPPYAISFFIFVILCIPGPLINSFAGILVLRFLLGFFGAPALATAGASLGDFWSPYVLPYMILSWTGGAILGPTTGPVIGNFAVQEENWRWSFWELLWISAPVLIVMLVSFPETLPSAILYRRASRLRQLTGRNDIRCAADVRQSNLTAQQILFDALVKPWEINALDPAVLFTTIYTSLIYSIFYSFFESFPLVYRGIYGFNLGQLGLAYLSVLVGVAIAVVCYCIYHYLSAGPRQAKMDKIPPEEQLRPGLAATFVIPVGLFIFAWTSNPSIPWIASMIGAMLSMGGIFVIATCTLGYLPYTYPQYAGSLFAANNLARSCFAVAAILYAGPMFERLGVAGGVSLLAGLMCLCTVGFYALFNFGPTLRRRSRFAVS